MTESLQDVEQKHINIEDISCRLFGLNKQNWPKKRMKCLFFWGQNGNSTMSKPF
jgi:hypothetical protein